MVQILALLETPMKPALGASDLALAKKLRTQPREFTGKAKLLIEVGKLKVCQRLNLLLGC